MQRDKAETILKIVDQSSMLNTDCRNQVRATITVRVHCLFHKLYLVITVSMITKLNGPIIFW